MNPLSNRLSALAVALLLATTTSAQSLDGQVVRNPDTTVTYTIDLDGPPSGAWIPIVSLRQGLPQVFPGVLGLLELDPNLLFPMGLRPLDPQGQGQAQINGPGGVANGLPLFFQALVIDNNNQLAFPNFAMAVPNFALAPAVPQHICGTKYNGATSTLTTTFTLGPAGANVTVQVNGGQKAQGFLILDANGRGQLQLPIPGGMVRGDNVTILINGQPVASWNH